MGRPGLVQGHWAGNSGLFPNQTLLVWKRKRSSSGLGQCVWQAVGCEGSGFVFVQGQLAGAFATCSGTKTHGLPCRGVWVHCKGESTPFPCTGMASKKPWCARRATCTKLPHGEAHPPRGPAMEP